MKREPRAKQPANGTKRLRQATKEYKRIWAEVEPYVRKASTKENPSATQWQLSSPT